jgi:rSAM/selenodomain-associated transferase 1
LIGDLTAAQAAELHAAFLGDLLDRLRPGSFELRLAWALEPHEEIPGMPEGPLGGVRQRGADLGERLYVALAEAAEEGATVAAVGSDHPTLPLELVHRAFEAVAAGADIALGPAEDGGYYLIAVRPGALSRRLFDGIAWSTEQVLAQTLERCRELGLEVAMLPMAADVDTPDDLRRLATRLAEGPQGSCPRTRQLLTAWQLLPSVQGVGARAGGG